MKLTESITSSKKIIMTIDDYNYYNYIIITDMHCGPGAEKLLDDLGRRFYESMCELHFS